jgi:RNA polymerase sigma-70 factor (ECF subfamily)
LNSSATARILPLPLTKKKAEDAVAPATSLSDTTDVTDELLLSRLVKGDPHALACLFRGYAGLVRGIGRRILRDAAEAEDLVQEVFLFIHRKCGVFDSSKSTARSWIVQMTYHRAIERRRYLVTRQFYTRGEVQRGERIVGTPTTESDYSAEAVFGRNGLGKVLEDLSEDQRETLRLYFFEGYTLAEISEKLGQPRGNVRHHYYRGLDKLRKEMLVSTVRVAERSGK